MKATSYEEQRERSIENQEKRHWSKQTTVDGVLFTNLKDNPFVYRDGEFYHADGFEIEDGEFFGEYDTTTCGCCYEPFYFRDIPAGCWAEKPNQ